MVGMAYMWQGSRQVAWWSDSAELYFYVSYITRTKVHKVMRTSSGEVVSASRPPFHFMINDGQCERTRAGSKVIDSYEQLVSS